VVIVGYLSGQYQYLTVGYAGQYIALTFGRSGQYHGLNIDQLRTNSWRAKNIKAQPMCKFAQFYACHELFRF
jgi:hypothetical protein